MRFSLALPVDRSEPDSLFHRARAVEQAAAAIEAAGFDACSVTEHPFPPGAWVREGGHHALDPFVALSFAAAATQRLRLHTNCVIPAYRNPFLTAKAAASLDALSGGRLILGMAVGYLEAEYAALGVPFAERGRLTDEAVDWMKRAWSGEEIDGATDKFRTSGNQMLPRPHADPHPPLWFGGNSAAAIRRAARCGDGWMPFPAPARMAAAVRTRPMADLDDLRAAVAALREAEREYGRTSALDICFTPFALPHGRNVLDVEALADEAAELARIGVTWLSFHLPAADPPQFTDAVVRFGAEVLPMLRERVAVS